MSPTATNGSGTNGSALAFDHEQLVMRRGRRSGATVAVAIHSTVLGPALGGARMWWYPRTEEAITDVLRLAEGMTYKASAAGLDLGGGKGVICAPGPTSSLSWSFRREMLLDFADLVDSLDGAYITAEDVGTGVEDMLAIAERTDHVAGLPPDDGGSGDPSPFTAIGVEAAMRACVEHLRGEPDLRGLGVTVIGLGHVGARLAMRLANAGARLTVTDADPRKRDLAPRLDARWVEPEDAVESECDVLAPCALGGTISAETIGSLRARIVCGAANNQLQSEALADELAAAGILYAPDFIVNAGGLISCFRELRDLDEEWAHDHTLALEGTMRQVLLSAEARGLTPLAAARALAAERLDAAVAH